MSAQESPLRVAIIAGEVSGDRLGGDLVASLKAMTDGQVELTGVGGPHLKAQGLKSLFPFEDISLVGLSSVIAALPKLISHIRRTSERIVSLNPDVLIIIDVPDFSHRVAAKVRRALPSLPIVQYVAPTVWAWRPKRAASMNGLVDHVLALFPFEEKVMARLGGPTTTYVGHPMVWDQVVRSARDKSPDDRAEKRNRKILLLPGSRRSEIGRMLDPFRRTVEILAERGNNFDYVLPTVERLEDDVRRLTAQWHIKPQIVTEQADKQQAFQTADAALAASGTVLLELALYNVPTVSCYRLDGVMRSFKRMITTWSAALPNLIADRMVVPEFIDETIRPGLLARLLERLVEDTPEREAQLQGFAEIHERMAIERPPGEIAAEIVLQYARDLQRSETGV